MNQKRNKRTSLKVNVISNWVVLLVNIAIGFFLTPYIIKSVGKGDYGIWVLVSGFIGYFGLMQLGVGAGIMRYIPFYTSKGETQNAGEAFSTALAIYFLVSMIIFLVGYGLAMPISRWLGESDEFAALLRIISISAGIECITSVFDASLKSREKYLVANALAVIQAAFRVFLLCYVLKAGFGLLGMGKSLIFISVLGLIGNYLLLKRHCPDLKFQFGFVKLDKAKLLTSFGLLASLMSLGFMLQFQSDRIIIKYFLDSEALGTFAVAAMLMNYFRRTVSATSRVLRPRFSFLDGAADKEAIVALFLKSTRIVAIVSSGIALLCLVSGASFINLWVGEGFKGAFIPLYIMAVAHMIDQSQTPTISLLAGIGKQGVLSIFVVAEGVLCVILGGILTPRAGIVGMALAMAISLIVVQLFVRPFYVCRLLKINPIKYFVGSVLRVWLLVTAISGVYFAIQPGLCDDWLAFLASVAGLLLLYGISVNYLVLPENERLNLESALFRRKRPC